MTTKCGNRQLSEDVAAPAHRRRLPEPDGDRVLDLYRTLRPGASREEVLIAALTGSNFWVRTVMLAERKAARRKAPGLHVLARLALAGLRRAADGAPRDGPALRVRHNRRAGHDQGAPGARELAAVVSATWAAFARTGSPENPALPAWPAYTQEGRATMVLDSECRIVADPDRDARLLWPRIATS